MRNFILLIGAFLGLISVGGGAYIDHALSHTIDIQALSRIKTALHYHQLYAVIISVIGLLLCARSILCLKLSAGFFILGIILFSFSIYVAVITNAMIWIKLTPLGGVSLMLGWILLGASAFSMQKTI